MKPWVLQVWILVTTFVAITSVNIPAYAFIAPFAGLLAQPAWMYETWKQKQWGMFALSVWFFAMWLYGAYNVITS